MNTELRQLLEGVKSGEVSIEDAVLKIKRQPFDDLGFAKVDLHRKMRQGAAEVIYGSGKTPGPKEIQNVAHPSMEVHREK